MRVIFLRHSLAEPAYLNRDDKQRALSLEGEVLARRRRINLNRPQIDVVLCSGRLRTWQTARIVAGNKNVKAIITPELWHAGGSCDERLASMYSELGNSSVSNYMDQDLHTVMSFGSTGSRAIMKRLSRVRDDSTALVVGHGVLLPIICWALLMSEDGEIADTDGLNETQGFEFDLSPKSGWKYIQEIR